MCLPSRDPRNPRLGKRIDLTELLSHRVSIAPRTDLGPSGASPYQTPWNGPKMKPTGYLHLPKSRAAIAEATAACATAAAALATLAVGSLTIGLVVISRVIVRELLIKQVHLRKLKIDQLDVEDLRVNNLTVLKEQKPPTNPLS
jgi:hypothetical protein